MHANEGYFGLAWRNVDVEGEIPLYVLHAVADSSSPIFITFSFNFHRNFCGCMDKKIKK